MSSSAKNNRVPTVTGLWEVVLGFGEPDCIGSGIEGKSLMPIEIRWGLSSNDL